MIILIIYNLNCLLSNLINKMMQLKHSKPNLYKDSPRKNLSVVKMIEQKGVNFDHDFDYSLH